MTERRGVWAVIPARAGSKGVVDKNIRPLGGHPLLAYSVRAARRSPSIDRVLLSTDSPEYATIGTSYGAEAPFLRPPAISGDRSTDIEFVSHLLDWTRDEGQTLPRLLVHLRPTTPLRDTEVIDRAVATFLEASGTALRSVHKMSESAYKTFERDGVYLKAVGSGSRDIDGCNANRQSFPATYSANGYVDILDVVFVATHGKLHGDRVVAFETPRVTEVDTEDDFAQLEFEISRSRTILRELFE